MEAEGRGGTFIRLALSTEDAASNQTVTPKQRRKKVPPDKEKLRPALREILKRVLRGDMKDTREEHKFTKEAKAPIKATTRVSVIDSMTVFVRFCFRPV